FQKIEIEKFFINTAGHFINNKCRKKKRKTATGYQELSYSLTIIGKWLIIPFFSNSRIGFTNSNFVGFNENSPQIFMRRNIIFKYLISDHFIKFFPEWNPFNGVTIS